MSSDIVQLHLPHENSHLAPDRQRALCKAVAKICDIQIDDVLIVTQKQEHGLWVAIGVPKQLIFRLTGASGQVASPLWSAFQNAQLSLIPLHQPSERFDRLQSEDEILLRLLYLGAKQVIIRSELGGGYSGARVLLTEPIDQHNRAMASQIVKLASAEEIAIEQERYTRYVENYLPRITPRLKNRQIWEGKAGLCYDFVDGGVLGRTKTFENFYKSQAAVEPIIQTLRDLMVKEIGEQWYRQATPLTTTFAAEYGPNLVEHLLIRIRPGSPDGIWRRGQEPTLDSPYKRVDRDEILASYAGIVPGTLIQIRSLTVQEAKVDALKLYHPERPGIVVKVRYALDFIAAPKIEVGDSIVIRGEVAHNRQERLETIVLDAFANDKEFILEIEDLKSKTLNWQGREIAYPNPLRYYNSVLNTVLRGRKSLVHGDLHLRNILVDETGRSYLIDFALVSERHNIFDFIKLETYIRQMILSQLEYQFTFKQYLQFEEQLTENSLNAGGTSPEHAELRKAYQVIKALRTLAARYMAQPPDWRDEYFPALFLYNLAVLKYHENQENHATRLAFGTAAVLIKYIQGFNPPPPPKDNIVPSGTSKPETSLAMSSGVDHFTPLEVGIETLLSKLGESRPEYNHVLDLQLVLDQNLRNARLVDHPALSAERAQISAQLNRISRSILGISFRDLCPKIW